MCYYEENHNYLRYTAYAPGKNTGELIEDVGRLWNCPNCNQFLIVEQKYFSKYLILVREYQPDMPFTNYILPSWSNYSLIGSINRGGINPDFGHYWTCFYQEDQTVIIVNGDQVVQTAITDDYWSCWRLVLYKRN